MKIGILTQPLHSNYGGLLQAWALQQNLDVMGHSSVIINRVHNKQPWWYQSLARLKNEVLIALGKRKRYLRITDDLKELSEQYVKIFRQNRYKEISHDIKTDTELQEYVLQQKFDAYIVGSDQVWRPKYSPKLMTYFLDFAKENDKVKKIAYAASFGVDNWEFSKKETSEALKLAPLFDLITVRESSGVNLVEKYLKCRATHVLDPTMLLNREKYLKLIEKPTCNLHKSDGDLFCYVLDQSQEVSNSIKDCATSMGYKPFYCNYKTPFYQLEKSNQKEECVVPPVEQWLKSFVDAKMILTDSFHGVVFSIIFNKPFWVITNSDRGTARFTSLLKEFDLDNRIVSDISNIDWSSPIDWKAVNIHRSTRASESIALLSSCINEKQNKEIAI